MASVKCWVCKQVVPEESTNCNAGVGTQCTDYAACRERRIAGAVTRADLDAAKARAEVAEATAYGVADLLDAAKARIAELEGAIRAYFDSEDEDRVAELDALEALLRHDRRHTKTGGTP